MLLARRDQQPIEATRSIVDSIRAYNFVKVNGLEPVKVAFCVRKATETDNLITLR